MKKTILQNLFSLKSAAIVAAICMYSSMNAQKIITVPFNGIVTDVTGQPIKKVKVYNYDPKRFTFTDKKGKFGLTNVNATDTIHLVYKKKQYDFPVNGKKSMRIKLADQLLQVEEDEELVNLGMMYVKRREFNGSSSGLNGEELVRMGYLDIESAIVERVPGVSKIGGKMIIRGINSITLNNEPLYLVDQVEVASLSFVNIHDVDHIEVIKDANMYGAKGANGVIIITTKRGK